MVPPNAIPVVCALIEHNGRVLVAQRPGDKHLALKWEFPGGKVEPGEAPAAALVREIREELACDITIAQALPRSVYKYDNQPPIELIPFVCHLDPKSPEPQAREHASLAWARREELPDFDFAAADFPVLAAYLNPFAS